uniref:Uncharacterized protein n=1 Tax=viral metagenome TaxID=1070528 RepID=A0A2V0RL94_9ZZZZ
MGRNLVKRTISDGATSTRPRDKPAVISTKGGTPLPKPRLQTYVVYDEPKAAVDDMPTPYVEPHTAVRKPVISRTLDDISDFNQKAGEGVKTGLGEISDGFDKFANLFRASSEARKSHMEPAHDAVLRFLALTKFENERKRIRALPDITIVEIDRYFTVLFDPGSGITYVEWRPTEDIKNISSNFKNVGREWSEDFLAAFGMNIPAWTKRVKYIKDKYGMESEKVRHYGYSRGGGLATHMGGTGYGTGYFSSYLPDKRSKSKFSGDPLHDYLINPLSYSLMFRNILKGR